jgi:hypothetical protein
MEKFLSSNKEIQDEIRRLFKNATEIKCAVAFWGEGAAGLFKGIKAKNVQIVCNLKSGGTNPKVIDDIRRLKLIGIDNVKMLDKMHCKVYWTPKGVIVGSANASANGLGFEGVQVLGWEEAALTLTDSRIIYKINQWFKTIWKNADQIAEFDLFKAKEKWESNRLGKQEKSNWKKNTLLSALKTNNIDLKDHIISLCIEANMISNQKIAKRLEELKDTLIPKNWRNWKKEGIDKTQTEDSEIREIRNAEKACFREKEEGSPIVIEIIYEKRENSPIEFIKLSPTAKQFLRHFKCEDKFITMWKKVPSRFNLKGRDAIALVKILNKRITSYPEISEKLLKMPGAYINAQKFAVIMQVDQS